MQELGHAGGDDDRPAGPPDPARRWVHPSEVGLQHRTRTDRRRGTWLAAALVSTGVGLLALGASMGLGEPTTASSTPRPSTSSIASTLASLTVVTGQGRRTTTGVVIDGDGHVVTRTSLPTDTTEVWASCGGRQPTRADVLAHDASTGITLLAVSPGSGRPVIPTSSVTAGDEILVVTAGRGESPPHTRTGTLAPNGLRFVDLLRSPTTGPILGVESATTNASPSAARSTAQRAAGPDDDAGGSSGAVAFDPRGRFVGLVVAERTDLTTVVPADVVLDVVTRLTG